MSDFPGNPGVLPQFISPWTIYGPTIDMRTIAAATGGAGTMTWVANSAVYIPISLPWAYPVARVWWANGSTVASANCDFGVYTSSGKQIYHTGSTTQSGASALQFVTPTTPFILDPGNYYFAWVCDSTTSHANALALTTAVFGSLIGIYSQASALPLPSSATFAALGTSLGVPLCGITRTASGF